MHACTYAPQSLNTEELTLLSITTVHMNINIYIRLAYNNIITYVHSMVHLQNILRYTKSLFLIIHVSWLFTNSHMYICMSVAML